MARENQTLLAYYGTKLKCTYIWKRPKRNFQEILFLSLYYSSLATYALDI